MIHVFNFFTLPEKVLTMRGPSTSKEMVYLNVYDLHQANDYLHPLGVGAYHSGVEIGGKEWTFAGGEGAANPCPGR